jgi:starch-binding outer membrane protein, SusD/RagB family
MNKLSKNQFIFTGLLFSFLVLGTFSCTDLEDVSIDKVTDGSTIPPEQLLSAAYTLMYAHPTNDHSYALNEHPTDECQGPTRGTDWDDNGQWRQVHEQTWTPTHAFVVTVWDDYNKGHALANEVLYNSKSSVSVKAQASFLKAYYMYHIMDLYGQVPVKDEKSVGSVLSRAKAFDAITALLEAAIPNLAAAGATPSQKIVATKEAAQALLAKLYLNKGVYSAAAVSATYTFAAADMDKVIANCDAIISSGKFALAAKYFDNFAVANDVKSKELVFNFPYTPGSNPIPAYYGGNQRLCYPGAHYNQNPSGWNGFTTLADFYSKFEAGDQRKGGGIWNAAKSGVTQGFMVGQQFDDKGVKLKNRQGGDLIYTAECPLNGATEGQGIRMMKFEPDFDQPLAGGNDYAFIRYADVLLMKAEALLRKGDAAGAATLVNQVRTARGVAALTPITEANLLEERGRELYYEGWRRNDMIRFGKFNAPVTNRTATTPVTRQLYPIPQKEIEINPNLKQNAGY